MPPEVALTVVGSANLDLVARVERLPRPGETLTDAEFFTAPGGKGANQAVGAARLGARVRFVGAVGRDSFAEEALSGLREAGCDLDVVEVDTPTGVAVIYVDGSGENTIVVAPGANGLVEPAEPEGAVLCQLEIPLPAVETAASKASFFCLNAAPAKPVAVGLVRRADLVVVNRYELEALPETPRLTALTLGDEGAVLLEQGEEVARAAPPRVDAVDGTAAGDAFTACLVVSLLEGRSREEALTRACKAGALAASRPGAQPSLPTAEDVDAL
ncbi:MAG TPA: ribokinase [Gaiellaceae bacterium]|nr:ribokinase [Gaiellaceae bacterium]